ncbi:MAG: hypothetical protein WC821_02300 [archaeon]|jgi:hypothetical protein
MLDSEIVLKRNLFFSTKILKNGEKIGTIWNSGTCDFNKNKFTLFINNTTLGKETLSIFNDKNKLVAFGERVIDKDPKAWGFWSWTKGHIKLKVYDKSFVTASIRGNGNEVVFAPNSTNPILKINSNFFREKILFDKQKLTEEEAILLILVIYIIPDCRTSGS